MRNNFIFLAVCVVLLPTVHARESRQDVLHACAKQAKDKDLAGDAYAEFMRNCLKPPEGYKAPAFDNAQPSASRGSSALQPALTQPVPASSGQKP